MAAYRRVYDSHHLQTDCQESGSAPKPYARQSSTGYLYLLLGLRWGGGKFPAVFPAHRRQRVSGRSAVVARSRRHISVDYCLSTSSHISNYSPTTRYLDAPCRSRDGVIERTKVCRYSWHSAGWPFPMLHYNYSFS